MIQFAQSQYFLLLLIIPFLFLFHGINRVIIKRRLAKLGERELIRKITPRASSSKGWIKITLLSIALFFFTIALARPQLGARIKEVEGRGVEIMVALDVSNSMLAQDYSPNRLERAKLALSRLTDRLKEDRIGLIIFAGDAFVQLPITTDYLSAKLFLNSISTNSVPTQGTSLAKAIELAIKSFSSDSERKERAIIIITDGEDHEEDPVEMAKLAADLNITTFTIGVGSLEGKPIPMESGELLKDREGNIVVTKLDEETLIRVAKAGGGEYIKAGSGDFGLEKIVNKIKKMESESYSSVIFEDFNEQYFYFLAIALLFFILEFLVRERKWRTR